MLKELSIPMEVGEDFGSLWSDGRPLNVQDLLSLVAGAQIVNEYDTPCDFEADSLEVFVRSSFKVVCCYDKSRNGRYFVETQPGTGDVPEKRSQASMNDKRYVVADVLNHYTRQPIFIVHIPEASTDSLDSNTWVKMITIVAALTGWMPVFVGNEDDAVSKRCFDAFSRDKNAINMIGKTSSLLSLISIVQQAKLFVGCEKSGLTTLAKILRTSTAMWSVGPDAKGVLDLNIQGYGSIGKVMW
jgi:hypothetical protein